MYKLHLSIQSLCKNFVWNILGTKWHHICLKLLNFNYLFTIFQPKMLKYFVPLHQCRIYGSLKTWGKKYRGFWARGDALLTDLLGSSKHPFFTRQTHSLHGSAISSLKSAQLGTIKLQPCPPSAHSHPWVPPSSPLQQKPSPDTWQGATKKNRLLLTGISSPI